MPVNCVRPDCMLMPNCFCSINLTCHHAFSACTTESCPRNSDEVQNSRLEHLRSLMSSEDRVVVPELLVYEILAQGKRKSKTESACAPSNATGALNCKQVDVHCSAWACQLKLQKISRHRSPLDCRFFCKAWFRSWRIRSR